jgi:hypothetical protein
MRTREEAERMKERLAELNSEAPQSLVSGGLFYSVDQSPAERLSHHDHPTAGACRAGR